MCSIIGYLGTVAAAPKLVKGLKRMEYRGYDSVGIATSIDNQILIRKGVLKFNFFCTMVCNLRERKSVT